MTVVGPNSWILSMITPGIIDGRDSRGVPRD
jgi:hypothetical protein